MANRKRRLLLAAMILVVAVLAMTGSVARPVTVHSDSHIETYCRCVWQPQWLLFCYYCCDYSGCYYLYCDPAGC